MEGQIGVETRELQVLLENLDSDSVRAAEKYCNLLALLTSFCERNASCGVYADDIVIRALEIVASKLREGQNIVDPFAYTFTVTRNLVRDFYKKTLPLYLSCTPMDAVKCKRQQSEKDAIESEIGEECRKKSLNDLSVNQRDLIFRYYKRGLQCKEYREALARELDINVDALSNRVARIKRKLNQACMRCKEKLRAERLPAILQDCG